MREIKFRAWDAADEIMWQPLTLNDLLGGGWELTTKDHSSTLPQKDYLNFAHEDTVWMQFTGLHDKHGTEIYEGDIVKVGSRSSHVVYWETQAGFRFNSYMEDGLINNLYRASKKGEVIGNIYENLELIQEQS